MLDVIMGSGGIPRTFQGRRQLLDMLSCVAWEQNHLFISTAHYLNVGESTRYATLIVLGPLLELSLIALTYLVGSLQVAIDFLPARAANMACWRLITTVHCLSSTVTCHCFLIFIFRRKSVEQVMSPLEK